MKMVLLPLEAVNAAQELDSLGLGEKVEIKSLYIIQRFLKLAADEFERSKTHARIGQMEIHGLFSQMLRETRNIDIHTIDEVTVAMVQMLRELVGHIDDLVASSSVEHLEEVRDFCLVLSKWLSVARNKPPRRYCLVG